MNNQSILIWGNQESGWIKQLSFEEWSITSSIRDASEFVSPLAALRWLIDHNRPIEEHTLMKRVLE